MFNGAGGLLEVCWTFAESEDYQSKCKYSIPSLSAFSFSFFSIFLFLLLRKDQSTDSLV